MSIPGAVAELNQEIERLTELRDSLLQSSLNLSFARPAAATSVKKTVRKKSAAVKKSSPAKKRTLSAASRKRISDAAKARWAARKKAISATK